MNLHHHLIEEEKSENFQIHGVQEKIKGVQKTILYSLL